MMASYEAIIVSAIKNDIDVSTSPQLLLKEFEALEKRTPVLFA